MKIFADRLSYDEPVEWIAMMKWQFSLRIQVGRSNREEFNRVGFDMILGQSSQWEGCFQLSETDLDGHFPQTSNAEKTLVCRFLDEMSSISAEVVAALDEPEERVGIQQ
jgi:hypothetical protein